MKSEHNYNLEDRLSQAATTGMTVAVWGREKPDAIFIHDPSGKTHTWEKVNQSANRIVRLLRESGLKAGDAVAMVCSNRAEFVEVLSATQRAGMRITPINWHLTADEIAYIINDCEAKAVFYEQRAAMSALDQCPDVLVKVAIGGGIAGFIDYDTALSTLDGTDIPDPILGDRMMYTSGTTGRPKGVHRSQAAPLSLSSRRGYDHMTSVQLCAGPAYHTGPLAVDVIAAMIVGCQLIFIDKWDSELVLRTIAEKRVTHCHMVPIMFQRLLALPLEVKLAYDISCVECIIHGAAPCPTEVKRAMIEWFGPVLNEYYAGSEGGAGFAISSQEWLWKPGSVGKRPGVIGSKILDEQGNECPVGVIGVVYHQLPPDSGFAYYKDNTKTLSNRVGDYFTLGDIGYFDEDDYLFLTGRDAEIIISGGVNIYPQEIDNELIKHPAVADIATVGVPHDEWGEQVKAVILLKPNYEPSEILAQEILDFGRSNLPSFKVPRSVDFVTDLPRTDAGKILRNKVRTPYWDGLGRQI